MFGVHVLPLLFQCGYTQYKQLELKYTNISWLDSFYNTTIRMTKSTSSYKLYYNLNQPQGIFVRNNIEQDREGISF
jgi:hypothetical protein